MEHHVKDSPASRKLLHDDPKMSGKLELAHKFAQRRLRTFAEEIPQAFMVRFFGKDTTMSSTQLPEEEPGSIPWEGGEENKGDEPGETRDPHTQDPEGVDDDD